MDRLDIIKMSRGAGCAGEADDRVRILKIVAGPVVDLVAVSLDVKECAREADGGCASPSVAAAAV